LLQQCSWSMISPSTDLFSNSTSGALGAAGPCALFPCEAQPKREAKRIKTSGIASRLLMPMVSPLSVPYSLFASALAGSAESFASLRKSTFISADATFFFVRSTASGFTDMLVIPISTSFSAKLGVD